MIDVKITDEQLCHARDLYSFKALKNSITKGSSNIYGAIGEVLIWDQHKDNCEYVGEYNYDLIISGQTVDVKTKRTKYEPLPHYLCSIADTKHNQDPNEQQKCDWYCFVRVNENLIDAWILGWIRRDEFFQKAVYFKKGEIDPNSDNNFTFKEDCWNLPISELGNFE